MLNKIISASFLCLFVSSFLSAAKLEVTQDQIDLQEEIYHNCLSFHQAYQKAFYNIFNDNKDEDSLLSFIMEKLPDKQEAEQELDRIMNEESTVFKVQGVLDEPPPNGEKISKNWIFSLSMSDYDHIFYIIVNRCGDSPVYNYGFN
jgi:hypothetical protein